MPNYTTTTYDSAGRVSEKKYGVASDGSYSSRELFSYTYATNSKIIQFTDKNGHLQTNFINSRGMQSIKKDYGMASVNYVYDIFGRLTSTQDAGGQITYINYDTLGRKINISEPNTGTTTYTYYDNGQIKAQTDARGIKLNYKYDKANRVISELSSDSTVNTEYTYDVGTGTNLIGRIASVTDSSGESTIETTFSYDTAGNVTQYVKSIIDSDGTKDFVVGMTYDYQNRVVSTTYPDPDHTIVKNQYAKAGYLRAVTDNNDQAFVQYTRQSCSVNSVERRTGNGVTTTITYDPKNLRPLNVSTRNGNNDILENINYYHDSIGNITRLEDLSPYNLNTNNTDDTEIFTYDSISRLTKAIASGLYGTKLYSYTGNGNLTTKDGFALTYGDSSHPHAVIAYNGNTYSYDASGNMTSRNGQTLIYDAKNRLIEVQASGITKEKYTYDYSGFRIKKELYNDLGVIDTIFYNINGLYELKKTEGNTAYQFTKYIYGISGEIVAQVSGTTTTIGSIFPVTKDMYNWKNLKGFILKINAALSAFFEKSENVRYIFIFIFGLAVLCLLGLWIYNAFIRTEGFIIAYRWIVHVTPIILLTFFTFFCLLGCFEGLLSNVVIDGIYYFHPNQAGSIKFITDENGTVQANYRYMPYGELVQAQSNGTDISKYKYTAQEGDESTGLYYYKARFYDPVIGRFISADSIVPNPNNTQDFNRYMYTDGNPVKFNDPTGHGIMDYLLYYTIPGYSTYCAINSYSWGFSDFRSWVMYWYENYYCHAAEIASNSELSYEGIPIERVIIAESASGLDTESATGEIIEEIIFYDPESSILPAEYYVYEQDTGILTRVDSEGKQTYVGKGYAGRDEGLNNGFDNPDMQNVEGVGPLPRGIYLIGPQQNHVIHVNGEDVMLKGALELIPLETNEMFGRPGRFFMHGDNEAHNQTASTGCPIFEGAIRNSVAQSGVIYLIVVP